MADFLDVLARAAKATVEEGYYEHPIRAMEVPVSLRKAILQSRDVAVIAEIKGASPSRGVINQNFAPEQVASAMANGGAVGLSVLTEPKHFQGSLINLTKARQTVNLPILMKDIIVSVRQLDAAARIGANAVLLIQAIYDRCYGELNVSEMIGKAHSHGLEVLLEVHDEEEFQRALESEADLVGINNRNLGTLTVDLNLTKKILENRHARDNVVVSESGINTASDIQFLSGLGVKAFLIGSAIMSAKDIEAKVREFTLALKPEELKT